LPFPLSRRHEPRSGHHRQRASCATGFRGINGPIDRFAAFRLHSLLCVTPSARPDFVSFCAPSVQIWIDSSFIPILRRPGCSSAALPYPAPLTVRPVRPCTGVRSVRRDYRSRRKRIRPHPCPRPAPASQARGPDSPSGFLPKCYRLIRATTEPSNRSPDQFGDPPRVPIFFPPQ